MLKPFSRFDTQIYLLYNSLKDKAMKVSYALILLTLIHSKYLKHVKAVFKMLLSSGFFNLIRPTKG